MVFGGKDEDIKMIYQLKFKKEDGAKIFFISDLHIGHAKLLESRGFSTIEDHNNTIISNWNSVVDNDSTVFMLGDMVLGAGDKSFETYYNLLNILNYKRLYICSGNHHAALKKLWEMAKLNNEPIDDFYRKSLYLEDKNKKVYFIPNYYEIFIGVTPVILSHYPIISFNGQRAGAIFLHGHSHNSLHKTEWLENNYYKGKVMDVGYEGIKKPISFNEIKEIMDKKEIVTFDHH